MFSALSRGVLIVGSGTGQSRFIGCHADANPWAADEDATVLWFDGVGHFVGEVRVVAWTFGLRAQLDDLEFALGCQVVLDEQFEGQPCVVWADEHSDHNLLLQSSQ